MQKDEVQKALERFRDHVIAQAKRNLTNKDKNVSKFIKKAADDYLDQIIIDRRKLGIQSDDASTIIGLSKHAGRDIDKTVFYNNYNKKVGGKTAEESIRKVTIGGDRNHSRSLAIVALQLPSFLGKNS